MTISLLSTITTALLTFSETRFHKTARIAFIGNSFMYYNDLPRLMESISEIKITQDSCMRSASTFYSIYEKGNGMESIFNTTEAIDEDGEYDIGAPDVENLLLGTSNAIGTGNHPDWDFVVMHDRSYYPASNETREKSIFALQDLYFPVFRQISSKTVFMSTYAQKRGTKEAKELGINMTDVPTYTKLVKEGNFEYARHLEADINETQSPLIAPVGEAFMMVWKEKPEMWTKLFDPDGRHPSPHGTYLQACVLHCTLFGKAPRKRIAIPTDPAVLFQRARFMRLDDDDEPPLSLPTHDEFKYLYEIAEYVTLRRKGMLRQS